MNKRNGTARRRGSITVYLCLTLSVLLALLFSAVHSARVTAGRVAVASALEQSLYSVFGEYDRALFDRFGLLFVDGGAGGKGLRLGEILRRTEAYADPILRPGPGGRLLRMDAPEAEMIAYTLATDDDGAAFRRQVRTVMKEVLVTDALTEVSGQINELPDAAADFTEEERAEAEAIDLGEDYGDPIGTMERIRSLGLMNIAIPRGVEVSAGRVQAQDLADHRALQRGVGVVPQDGNAADRLMLTSYAMKFLPSFSDRDAGGGLRYRAEYIVGGASSDAANLKKVLDRLVLMREVSNFAFLCIDPEKRTETLAAATAVSSALLAPYLAPAIAVAIRAAWAYAESVLDLRTLLSGGKVPVIKTPESWQSSVRNLPEFLDHADEEQRDAGEGLDYEQYLRVLLLAVDADTATGRLMAMVEHTMRTDHGADAFRIDNCIDAMTVKLASASDGIRIERTEHYGYGTPS